ncbi:MAG: preprotein translocase, SecY subunit [Frankiales bacterium]|nr:preprotein translocase, SecY subunit [Frankiales bacterium]
MLRAFTQAFRTPDLRKKILFTVAIIAIYRLGTTVPAPGVDYARVQDCLKLVGTGGIYGLLNLFSGGALLQLSVFALGIMPYITASIIVQLLVVVIPRFEALKKQGQAGQTRLTQYTRYLTIALGILQSTAIVALARSGALFQAQGETCSPLPDISIFRVTTLVLTMTAGTAVIMWLGELITERGVGNGMSLLIFTSIIARAPSQGWQILKTAKLFGAIVIVIMAVMIITFVIFVEQAQRRIPVQYAKRMIGRRMYGGTSTYLPMKVNQAGVIPVIFASSLLYVPYLLTNLFTDKTSGVIGFIQRNLINTSSGAPKPGYLIVYLALIFFFTYFYVAITFDTREVSDNMKKYGGFIPGIRPGRPTAEYLDYIQSRLTFPGALFLSVVAMLPFVVASFFPGISAGGDFLLGGTALLIVVGVGLDTVKQIDSQLMLRNYEGFLR